MRRHLPAAVMAAIILMGGTIHGLWTNRWVRATELQHATDHLEKLPLKIGDWEGEDNKLEEGQLRQFDASEAVAWVTRSYVHSQTGEVLSLLALCGPPGPTSTHSPEACYGGGGYNLAVPPVRQEFPIGPGQAMAVFQVGDFRRVGAASEMGLKIYWSYRGGSNWEVPSNPRVAFARYPALYKVYVVRQMAMAAGVQTVDTVTPQFIRSLLPELEKLLPRESGQPTSP